MSALRVGLMVPINNTTMERELLAWLPSGSTCRTLKIPRSKGLLTRETVPAYVDNAIELARDFAHQPLDVVVYGCTAAGFLMGPEADARLSRDLGEASGKPVVTTAASMVLALQHAGARRISVVSPYTDEVNRQLTAYLATGGIEVARLNTFGAADTEALGRITAGQVKALALETVRADDDALFIACSQLPTHEIREEVQGKCGRPVWSSIYATAWQTQRALADRPGR